MTTRGKLIVIEGIDGSGKRTQLLMLVRALVQRGIPCLELSYPRYDGFFGKMVGDYLNGGFGPLASVDPHFSALLYAGDRLETRRILESALFEGKVILADRYVPSNLAHQGARVAPEKRAEFIRWLRELEYQIYGLPEEDLVIYLRLSASESQRRVATKSPRDYTAKRQDLHEADLAHLQAAAEMYDRLAEQPNWVTVDGGDGAADHPRGTEDIQRDILATVDSRIFGEIGERPSPERRS
jgi:dTMP kinase